MRTIDMPRRSSKADPPAAYWSAVECLVRGLLDEVAALRREAVAAGFITGAKRGRAGRQRLPTRRMRP
jgi:hypothetical protein